MLYGKQAMEIGYSQWSFSFETKEIFLKKSKVAMSKGKWKIVAF